MKKTIKAKFDGLVLVPAEAIGLAAGDEVEVSVRRGKEPARSSAAASRLLVRELSLLPKPDEATMTEYRRGVMDGVQPRADISPFGDAVDDEELVRELNDEATSSDPRPGD